MFTQTIAYIYKDCGVSVSFFLIKVEYWTHPDDEDDDNGKGIVEEVLVNGPQNRAEVTGLKPDTSYRAHVSVVNMAFTGPPSNLLTFTTAEGGQFKDWEIILDSQ